MPESPGLGFAFLPNRKWAQTASLDNGWFVMKTSILLM